MFVRFLHTELFTERFSHKGWDWGWQMPKYAEGRDLDLYLGRFKLVVTRRKVQRGFMLALGQAVVALGCRDLPV